RPGGRLDRDRGADRAPLALGGARVLAPGLRGRARGQGALRGNPGALGGARRVTQRRRMREVSLTGTGLSAEDVVAVARDDARVRLAPAAREAMGAGAAIASRHAESDEPVYGVSTGFGSLATTPIPAERRAELQRALLRSHAAGVGEPIERE